MNTSNSSPARARSLPFERPRQRIWFTVRQKWSGKSAHRTRGTHSSSNSRIEWRQQRFARFLERGERLLLFNGREMIEELVQGVPVLEIVEERLHRHARPPEAGSAAHDFR